MMGTTREIRARLASIIDKMAKVMECDNLEVCPLCEVPHPKRHDAHCGFRHAGDALIELVILDHSLKEGS